MIDETLIDSTTDAVNVKYRYRTTFNGCTDSSKTVEFIMNPAPVVPDQKLTICSGIPFTLPTSLEPLKTTYTWASPVVLPVAGSLNGYTSAVNPRTALYDTLNNTSNTLATAVYTVIPSNPICALKPFNVNVYVKPISLIGKQTINTCNESKLKFIPTGVPDSTTYKWMFNDPLPPYALTGQTNNDSIFLPSINQTLYNSGNDTVAANYLVTTNTAGCTGKSFGLKAIVNPTPKVKLSGALVICKNMTDTLQMSFTGTPPWSISYFDTRDSILKQISGLTRPVNFFLQNMLPGMNDYTFSVYHVNDAFCNNDTSAKQPLIASITQNIFPVTQSSILAPNGTLICIGNYQPWS